MYVHFEGGKKTRVKQEGNNWAIRKSMHKDTVYGEVNIRKIKTISLNEAIKNPSRVVEKEFKTKLQFLLKEGYDTKQIKNYFEDNKEVWQDINLSKIAVYYFTKETKDRFFATRFLSDLVGYFSGVSKEADVIKKIEAITDTGIQKILKAHFQSKNNNLELAFSADGIDEMNKNIVQLNNGKPHKPIYKIRRCEKGTKFAVGNSGNKSLKFVEADEGTNLYFAVYVDDVNKKRTYATIPLKIIIERRMQGLSLVPVDGAGQEPKFFISPNDLVYVPTIEEIKDNKINLPLDVDRLYKMVSANKNQCFFTKENVANSIVNKYEFSSANKMERALTGEMIKEVCIPVKVDRLGNITKIGY